MIGELTQLTITAATVAFVCEQMSWPQEPERFDELRSELVDALSAMRIDIGIPETHSGFKSMRPKLQNAIIKRLSVARSTLGGDTVALPFFAACETVCQLVAGQALGMDVSQERKFLSLCLKDIHVGDLMADLDNQMALIDVHQNAEGEPSISQYEIVRTAGTFIQRIGQEWGRREEIGSDVHKLLDALRNQMGAVHIHGAASIAVEAADALIIERVDHMVQEKVITIGNGVTVNAPVVAAEHIQNSFNAIANAQVSEELKKLMTELVSRVAEASTNAPEQASTLARDAEALSAEVASGKPRRKWYELSVEGLSEAAKAIGIIGEPILDTLGKLSPLLMQLWP